MVLTPLVRDCIVYLVFSNGLEFLDAVFICACVVILLDQRSAVIMLQVSKMVWYLLISDILSSLQRVSAFPNTSTLQARHYRR